MIKARYYPNTNILSAPLGHNPSWFWRSILDARWVIEEGSKWRVGNGEKIKVWKDKWLSSEFPSKIISPVINEDMLVSDLIDKNSKKWKVDVIKDNFFPFEAEAILSIPISFRLPNDEYCWIFSKDGSYNVRSAYHFIRWSRFERYAPSASTGPDSIWRLLWASNVAPRVKHFIWKATVGALPVKEALNRRHCNVDEECIRCPGKQETLFHVLLSCCFARQVWDLWDKYSLIIQTGNEDFLPWLCWVFKTLKEGDVAVCLTLLWSIWNARNSLIFERKMFSPECVYHKSISFVHCYWKSMESTKSAQNMIGINSQIAKKWAAPGGDLVKLNCDAAKFGDWAIGLGMVVRDAVGDVLISGNRQLQQTMEVCVAEALAIRFGMEITLQSGFSKIIVESDSLQVICALKNKKSLKNSLGLILDDIFSLSRCFNYCDWSFVYRSGNQVAHTMANLQPFTFEDRIWIEEGPHEIEQLVSNDIALSDI